MDKSTVVKSHNVTRPSIMVKWLGPRGAFYVKFKIQNGFLNDLVTASVLVENHVILHEIQQLGYLNSNLMLLWESPFYKIALSRNSMALALKIPDSERAKFTYICTTQARAQLFIYSGKSPTGWVPPDKWSNVLKIHPYINNHFHMHTYTYTYLSPQTYVPPPLTHTHRDRLMVPTYIKCADSR